MDPNDTTALSVPAVSDVASSTRSPPWYDPVGGVTLQMTNSRANSSGCAEVKAESPPCTNVR